MDFDIPTEEDVYALALKEARLAILQGLNVEADWKKVQERHPFFRDVVSDAQQQAKQLAPVLAAAEFFLKFLLCCCGNGSAPTLADVKIVKQWLDSIAVFISLYESFPVPTRVQWEREVSGCLDWSETNDIINVQECNNGSGQSSNKNLCNNENCGNDDDDGSFVETRLKELLLHCVRVGRKWCRELHNKEGEESVVVKVRRAVSLMNHFVAPKTLDW